MLRLARCKLATGRVYPEIMITEDNPLINCDPARANGQLSATADGGKVGGYSFEWHGGSTATGTILSSNYKLIGHTKAPYTVHVTNYLQECPAEATGRLPMVRCFLQFLLRSCLFKERRVVSSPMDGWPPMLMEPH